MALRDALSVNVGEPGFFDQAVNQQRAQNMMSRYGLDPTAGANDFSNIGLANRNAGFGAQADVMAQYRRQAMGQGGPSMAQMQMRDQAQRNMMESLALSARSRGGNIAGMQNQAMASNAYAGQQLNRDAAMLAAQEQQAAQAAYAGMANQLAGQGLAYSQLGAQTSLGASQNALGWYSADRGMDMQQQQSDRNFAMGLYDRGADLAKSIMGGAGAGAQAGMMSDERAKENIVPTTLAASQAVGEITPSVYNYKPGYGPGGSRVGPMADDLEKNPLTASLVTEGPDGLKRVDVGGLAALATAASAEQEGRIRALEQQSRPGMLSAVPRTAPRDAGVAQYAPDQDIDFGSRVAASRNRQQRQGFADYDFTSVPFSDRAKAMGIDGPRSTIYRDQRTLGPWAPGARHDEGERFDPTLLRHDSVEGHGDPRVLLSSRPSMATIDPFEYEGTGSSGLGQFLSDKRAKTVQGSTISQQMTRNSRGGY